MTGFIPNQPDNLRQQVIYFEDANAAQARGKSTQRTVAELQSLIAGELGKLGALVLGIVDGVYPDNGKRRYGYQITFLMLGNLRGRIDVAALPIRSETAAKKQAALQQALYALWQSLQSERERYLFTPNSPPLMQYLLAGDSGRTISEEFAARMLPAPMDMIALGDGK